MITHRAAQPILDMVLVGGEWRAVGVVSAADLEELERMHDAGDVRAEVRLKLLREGRPGDRAAPSLFGLPVPPAAANWYEQTTERLRRLPR